MKLGILRNRTFSINFIALLVVFTLLTFTGCSTVPEEVQPQDYIVKVDEQMVDKTEMMIYVNQVMKEFEKIGGQDVWSFEDFSGGKSAEEAAKEAVIDNVVRIKVLVEKSKELNVTLSDDQIVAVQQEALNYLNNIDDDYIKAHDITLEKMVKVFTDFTLANEVKKHVTDNFVPSVTSVDEKMQANEEYTTLKNYKALELLTSIRVEHILLLTRDKDQSGDYVTLTDDEKAIKYNTAVDIRKLAQDGADFTELMKEYSEETFPGDSPDNGIYEFSKALIPEEFDKQLKDLDQGDVSEIIESDLGFHIFKVIEIIKPTSADIQAFNDNFVQYELELRKSVAEELKDEAFNSLYEEWKKSVNISVNRDAWEEISLQE